MVVIVFIELFPIQEIGSFLNIQRPHMRKDGSLRYQGGSWGLGLLPEMLSDLSSPTVKHDLSKAVAMHQKEL